MSGALVLVLSARELSGDHIGRIIHVGTASYEVAEVHHLPDRKVRVVAASGSTVQLSPADLVEVRIP